MAELAQPDNYQGSEPELVVYTSPRNQLNGNPIVFFTTGGGALYRIRFVTVIGTVITSAGTAEISFEELATAVVPAGWPTTGPLACTVPHAFANGEAFMVEWSTEIADNYLGTNVNWGTVAVQGLPLVYIPEQVQIALTLNPQGVNTASANIQQAMIQYDKFQNIGAQAVGPESEQRVYLLQAAKPGDAGAFG